MGELLEISILIEDTYGPKLIENLIKKLKSAGVINSQIKLKPFKFTISKLKSLIRARRNKKNKIIVIVDCDGDCGKNNASLIMDICHAEMLEDKCIVKLTYEIEEWICIVKGLSYNREKPSEMLRRKMGYEKYTLPKFADTIVSNIDALKKKSSSFRDFIECLK